MNDMSREGSSVSRTRSADRPSEPIEGAFEKRLLILSCFSSERRVLTPQAIGRVLDLSQTTVEELAMSLIGAGCLERDDAGAFTLAPAKVLTITVKDERRFHKV